MKILVIHGPNLNLLGKREVSIYGTLTLEELNASIQAYAREEGTDVLFFQSNHEGAIIDCIQQKSEEVDGMLINPAAYTHYSIAIRDAIAAVDCPVVEVHLSNINTREEFRRVSVIKNVCIGQISGMGVESYFRGIDLLHHYLGAIIENFNGNLDRTHR